MKKIFDYTCVIVTALSVTIGLVAVCNFIATDVKEAYGSVAGVVTFFGSFAIVCVAFVRWLVLLQKVR